MSVGIIDTELPSIFSSGLNESGKWLVVSALSILEPSPNEIFIG
jgi:hypothetical protein